MFAACGSGEFPGFTAPLLPLRAPKADDSDIEVGLWGTSGFRPPGTADSLRCCLSRFSNMAFVEENFDRNWVSGADPELK